MGTVYAEVSDLIAFGHSLTAAQSQAAQALIEQASAKLRIAAEKYGADIDSMIAIDSDYALAVKSIVVQAVMRAVNSTDDSAAISQGSESIGAYSVSMTYVNAGQSLYFLRNELKELGLVRQKYGALDLYGNGGG